MQEAVTAASHGAWQLPEAIANLAGEINDIDAHEVVPTSLWVQEFGEDVRMIADAMFAANAKAGDDKKFVMGTVRDADDTPIDATSVWQTKMQMAPGAWDMQRRLDVMDFTGIRRQILFPGSMALRSMMIHARADDPTCFPFLTGDRRLLAARAVTAYNQWCVKIGRNTDRLRPAAILFADSPEELYASAKDLIAQGVRGLMLPTGRPPGGYSPAHPALDPLWDLLSSSGTPLFAHIGADDDFIRSHTWGDAPAFEGWRVGDEFKLDPWTLSTIHLGVQNFITVMVLGGVFERFPRLFMSCNEFGAHWVGPLAENMDLWQHNQPFASERGVSYLKMKPSEYLRRNLRVAPFYFEDVGLYIERHGLEDVFCYGSDYPHFEGGKDPIGDMVRSLEAHGLGERVMRKFFVENARVIFSD